MSDYTEGSDLAIYSAAGRILITDITEVYFEGGLMKVFYEGGDFEFNMNNLIAVEEIYAKQES